MSGFTRNALRRYLKIQNNGTLPAVTVHVSVCVRIASYISQKSIEISEITQKSILKSEIYIEIRNLYIEIKNLS